MNTIIRGAARVVARPVPPSRWAGSRIGLAGLMLMLLIGMAGPLMAHEFTLGAIEIGHPFARATPHGAKVAGGYLKLKNNGAEADRLVSATIEIADRSEIHTMAVDDKGVMTMRPVPEGIEIPAGGEVELKPGSFHLMFLAIDRGLVEGERVKGSLTFEKAGTLEIEFAVEAMGGPDHSKHGG